MRCSQCGKKIPDTNQHTIIFNGTHMNLCGKHYSQYIKYKKFLDESPKSCKDSNEYEIDGDTVWIICFNRNNEPSGKFCIDLEDFDRVIAHKWRYWKNRFYTGNKNPIAISRFILSEYKDVVIDHIDGDVSNNCKSNLRPVTQQQNVCNKATQKNNSSGIPGVEWDSSRKKWSASIRMNGIRCHFRRMDKFEDAVYCRYYAETLLFKEFRSDRNDKKLFEIIKLCVNKKEIENHVAGVINQKFKNI